MSIFPPLPQGSTPELMPETGHLQPEHPEDSAINGSPARRPGDPDPAPADTGEPLFSTDPLAGR